MSFFRGYLKERWKRLLMLLLFVCIFAVSFWFYRLPVRAVMYPCALCLLFGAVFVVYDMTKAYRRHKFFEELHRRNTELISALPEPEGIVDSDYQQLISVLKEKIAEITAQTDSRIRDTVDYYTVWAHQIKTPIAAMRLTLQKEDVPEARRLASELSRIEQYVEMVLVFIRLGSNYSDYVFARQDIDEIIRSSVKKFASEFIDRRIRLEYDSVDIQAVTDEKWFAFVVEQLLSNALKYTREGSIKIYSEGKVLCIKDTGIGIAPEDLPRVFDKGYTGCNGRTDRRASGLGLYLCRRICQNLGIDISISSTVGEGTTVSLDLGQYKLGKE
ncbi:MAG: sensor histidine kinase [Acutalibacteraceae bacterium]|nr:sensor histidine kinase [Acutalibacteraceae bacterium]